MLISPSLSLSLSLSLLSLFLSLTLSPPPRLKPPVPVNDRYIISSCECKKVVSDILGEIEFYTDIKSTG